MARFLVGFGDGYFSRYEGEDTVRMLLRFDEAFSEYCNKWESSMDVPSRLCNNLLKLLEAYFRCVHSVKRQNFWMCEAECNRWLGAFKLAKKKNYVQEGLHRIDTLYGGALTPVELEEFRCNRFFLMTEDGNAMSMDEVNEHVNHWFKKCLCSPTFKNNVVKSKHIMTLKRCSADVFGRFDGKRSRSEASQKVNVDKLIALFERTGIFPSEEIEKKFDENDRKKTTDK
jgi:hypothetical protein